MLLPRQLGDDMPTVPRSPVFRVLFSIAAVVLFSLLGCAHAPPKRPPVGSAGEYAPLIAYLRDLIPKELKRSKAQCASIALIEDQRVIWSAGFGNATTESPTPATDRTLYRIGSITKLFTALAVVRLWEQGKLDLDRPLETYLPEYRMGSLQGTGGLQATGNLQGTPEGSGKVTPRNLLTHHSGLPRDHFQGTFFRNPEEAPARFGQWPQSVAGDNRIGPADRFFAYSNLGFGLLGNMVAKVSGVPYSEYIQDSLLAPMGMAHSSVLYKPEWDSLLSRTRVDGKEIPGSEINLRNLAAGSVYSSAADLSRFMRMIFAGGVSGPDARDSGGQTAQRRILARATLDTMLTPQNAAIPADENLNIGLSFFLSKVPTVQGDSIRVFNHGGSLPGFESLFIGAPDLKVGMVLLVNGGPIGELARTSMAALIEAKLGRKLADPEPPRRMPEVRLGPEKLAAFTGRYAVTFDDDIADAEITREGGRLKVKVNGKDDETLIPIGEDAFRLQHNLLGFIPIRPKEGYYLRWVTESKAIVGGVGKGPHGLVERIRADTVPEVWRKRVGRYVCVNPDDSPLAVKLDMRLIYQSYSGLLYWTWNNPKGHPLKILSPDEAAFYGTDGPLRVITENGVETLEYSGFRFVRAPS
jgi:CubicO group peptidase (beta-lactamase class C family)